MSDQKKILVVDDEPDVLNIIKIRVKAAGHEVVTASNGQEALDYLKKNIPDLIISDVVMPVMDGFKFYKEIKGSKTTADIPVLILTARGKMEDSFKVMGADEFIAKPFEMEDFMVKVNGLLGRVPLQAMAKPGFKVVVSGTENETIQKMAALLKKIGCAVEIALAGPEIISKSIMAQPQLVIMEVQMEGMLSHEIIKVLRQMPILEKVPILTYSFYRAEDLGSEDVRQKALSVDSAQAHCKEAGATDHIGRFDENTFLKAIRKYL